MGDSASVPSSTGDRTFEGLYRQQWAPLLRLAWLMIGTREAAEDLVHDVFVRLEPRWPSLDDPVPYLRRMVINAARDHHRHAVVEERHRPAETSPVFNPEVDELWDALRQLPDRQRHALVLRYYADYSLQRVAATLDCPLGTAKSLIHRGLARLKDEVGG